LFELENLNKFIVRIETFLKKTSVDCRIV